MPRTCRSALAGAALMAVVTACSAGPPAAGHRPKATSAAPAGSHSAPAGHGIPSTYQQACAETAAICSPGVKGAVPAVLDRPLHFPKLRAGQACPATPGHLVNTPVSAGFGGIALGTGLVRPIITGPPHLTRRGVGALLTHTSAPPWLAMKTLWFSVPAYQGPFVIRAKRLDGRGPVGLGESPPRIAPLVVPPGPTLNGGDGYRTAPGGTWVRAPGCYAWQVDGLTFSEIIVVRLVRRHKVHAAPASPA